MRTSLIAVIFCSLLASCTYLPNSGPMKGRIEVISDQKSESELPRVQLIEVNNKIIDTLVDKQQSQSFVHFSPSKSNYQGAVNAGDLLDITIWEAPPATLFGGVLTQNGVSTGQSIHLPEQMVSHNGKITIPFVGTISVAGKTTEKIQSEIVYHLQAIANQPQAVVRIVKNNSANVTVLSQNSTLRMPLTAYGERVLDAVAASGTTGNIQDVSVQLTRDNQVRTIPLSLLTADSKQNILLRKGDVVTLLNSPLSFTAMGAVGNSKEIRFAAHGLMLAEAIGRFGGLNDDRADPRGIFVFRYLPFEQLSLQQQIEWEQKGFHKGMSIPTVYQVDLLEPKSMFWIQHFPIENKDIVYVSNAPLSEYQKFIRMIFGATNPALSTINSTNNL